jgi:sulfite reductase (NADPH) hemoprotein beta-component
MYAYDEIDQRLVDERVAEFRDQVARRLSGTLTEDQFKPLRLRNGIYLQLHAYMLRVAIPYGTLSSAQMRGLAQLSRRFDRGWGHFTTRQNIQFNWVKLEEMPDALAHLATVQMHAIQTSGACVRNVTVDHWAGVAPDEIEDPRIAAELIRQWSTFHPEFSFLPRKFKIAITGSPEDRAAIKVHDIGLRLHRNATGEAGYEVLVGGGLGRTPMIGKTIRSFVPQDELLPYLEAILRVYNAEARRDNLYKSRIKILVHDIGIEAMRERVEAEFACTKTTDLSEARAEYERIRAFFAPPAYGPEDPLPATLARARLAEPDFARWEKTNVFAHRVPGYGIVEISLKPEGGPPGDAAAAQMDLVADLAARFSHGEIRVTHAQNLVLPHVRLADLPELWRALRGAGLGTANIAHVSDIIACPGLDYCALANARSIPVAQRLARRFADLGLVHEIGELKVKISGCINACGHHHVGHIGILGVDKHGEEHYQITLGGTEAADAALGKLVGPAVPSAQIADAVERIVRVYLARRADGERLLDTVRRLGLEPFRDSVYETA